ncbi:hypothetical protein KKE92_06260 [Candidatus Micrarchaeota archaeon]|nr:hypothetical protein [Candidatus Micrarchaeota archaeon]
MPTHNKLFTQIQIGEVEFVPSMEQEWNGIYNDSILRGSLLELLRNIKSSHMGEPSGDFDGLVVQALTLPDPKRISGKDIQDFHDWLVASDLSLVNILSKAIARESSEKKQLIYFKMLEELSICSIDPLVWRHAMMELSKPLIPGLSPIVYSPEAQRIATLALERILVVEGRRSTPNAHKSALAGEILSSALFHYDDQKTRSYAIEALTTHQKERSIPALLALSSAKGDIHVYVSMLMEISFMRMHPLLNGDSATLALLSRGETPPRNAVVEQICHYMSHAISVSDITTPHPHFLATGTQFPLPRFPENGLQENVFRALSKVDSTAAFVTMVDGVSDLILPHIPNPESLHPLPRPIKSALPTIADCILDSGKRLGVPGTAEFLKLFLGHPNPIKLNELSGSAIEAAVPFAAHVLLRRAQLGNFGSSHTGRIAERVLLIAGTHLEDKGVPNSSFETTMRTFLERHAKIFNTECAKELVIPEVFGQALKAFTSKRLAPPSQNLPPKRPKHIKARAAPR